MTDATQVPRLRAVTRPLSQIPDVVSLADPINPLLWTRDDRGCVGIGEVLRFEFHGAGRFDEAARLWQRVGEAAEVDDTVRLPGTGLLAFGTFTFADDSAGTSTLIVPRSVVARHRGAAWITEISLQGSPEPTPDLAPPEARPVGAWSSVAFPTAPDADAPATLAYLHGVEGAAEQIRGGDVQKIVLSRQIEGTLPAGSDLRVPLGRLAERYTDCWTFAVDGLIGASPETLIRSTGGAVSARVLAGTRGRRTDNPTVDNRRRDELLTSAKEQHEHAFAVQSVVTALAPHVTNLSTTEEPFALRLPNVWHLATDLGAHLADSASAVDLVGALHPTAAVAGTPTATAIHAIAELEPFDRGRYSGAVGWIDAAGDGEWVIALRCAELSPAEHGTRRIVATAGGGIVEGSDPRHELAETVSKFSPIVEAFE
ncbi:MAG: isochorismate synthase [Leucobacter sp.]